MKSNSARACIGLLTLVATIFSFGCDWDGKRERPQPNQPPTVRITGGAAEGSSDDYRVEFFWFGSDPDGTVSHFLVAIDDTCLCSYEEKIEGELVEVQGETVADCLAAGVEPNYTSRDSIWKRVDAFFGQFDFTASIEVEADTDPALSTEFHVFYIKAVDDKGLKSAADRRAFNALTIAPDVRILAPKGTGSENHQKVSTFVSIRWFGRDEDSSRPDKKPVGYQLKMVKLANIFESRGQVVDRITNEFICNQNPNTLIPDSLVADERSATDYILCDWYPKPNAPYKEETLQLQNVERGEYAFAVRAIDQANAITPDRVMGIVTENEADTNGNIVKLDVDPFTPVNPHILIRERNFLGSHNFIVSSTWEVVVPVNVPLRFEWDVTADHYGSRIGGVNFAIDIPDPGCEVCQSADGVGGWIGWGSWTGVPQQISFTSDQANETHLLFVRARDDSFRREREIVAVVQMEVIAFSFDKTALLIDDFSTSGLRDCNHDVFVRGITEYGIEPYLQVGEELDRYDAHPPGGAPCTEQSGTTLIELSELARYKLLYWNLAPTSGRSLMGQLTNPPTRDGQNAEQYLKIYLKAGGNLVVWGQGTAGEMFGGFYPVEPYNPEIPLYPDPNFGPGTFVWDILRIETQIDREPRGTSRALSNVCSGAIGMQVTQKGLDLGFPAGVPDPTGYDTSRTAIWSDLHLGHENSFGALGANTLTGRPPLSVSGMDTLYTHVSNSWSYRPADENGVYDPTCETNPDCDHVAGLVGACGSRFLSVFEKNPAVIRFKDPGGEQGRWVWGMQAFFGYAESHTEDMKLFMRLVTDWIFDEG